MKRDRNHPSVIMWSICNEVLCKSFNGTSAAILKGIINEYDLTRPVTAAMNGDNDEFTEVLDVHGRNYSPNLYDGYKRKWPN